MRATIAAAASTGASERAAAAMAARWSGSRTSRSVHHSRSPSRSASSSTTAGAGLGEDLRVVLLVPIGGMRIRNQHAGGTADREFGERRGAGARDDRVGGSVGVGRIVEVRDETDAVSGRRFALLGFHVGVVAFAADVQQLPGRRKRAARHQRRDGFIDRARALTSTHRSRPSCRRGRGRAVRAPHGRRGPRAAMPAPVHR